MSTLFFKNSLLLLTTAFLVVSGFFVVAQTALADQPGTTTNWCNGADINKDTEVDVIDLGIFAPYYGSSGCAQDDSSWCDGADINKDGAVDIIDFSIVGIAYGSTGCSGSTDPAPAQVVNLGTAGNFAILSYAGITDANTSIITGNIGAYPISGTGIGVTCPEVTGIIYSSDDAGPLPCVVTAATLLNTAMGDLTIAYNDALSRETGLGLLNIGNGSGDIGDLTLAPGVYTFNGDSNNVEISTALTLNGGADDVWIFQIPGTFDVHANVILGGEAQAKNIFWTVAGATTIFPGFTVNGNILDHTSIAIQTGAVLNGRALAETESVTLDANTITAPVAPAPTTYTVTFDSRSGSVVAPTTGIISGSTITLPPAPTKDGYTFAGWYTEEEELFAETTLVTADITVYANWNALPLAQYTLTYTAGGNGSITGILSQTVNSGSDGSTVTAVANAGYHFTGWSDDSTTNPRTDTNVTANIPVTANFVINNTAGGGGVPYYSVSASAGANGSISPVGSTSVASGGSQIYTITPAVGYQIASVLVDGTSVGTVTTYTFSNVTTGHTISATFAVTGTVSAASTIIGDINGDGNVDEYDFSIMMSQWGQAGTNLSADLNHDGVVNEYDFAILMANWGL